MSAVALACGVYRCNVAPFNLEFFMNKSFRKFGAAGATLLATSGAFAAPIDVTAVVTEIGGQAAPIALIGAAVLLIAVGIKAFRWVRSSLS